MSDLSPNPRFSLVVPLYNEEENIAPLQDEVARVLEGWDYELILVNDGSNDRTLERIVRGPRVRVLNLRKNSGQSAAMYVGIQAARGGLIGLMDGDLQNDPADFEALVAEVEKGADLACGYRANRRDTWFKKVQSRIANGVRSRFTGDGVRDTGCTLKVMRAPCRSALVPFRGMHRFIPALVKAAGFELVEVPVRHRARQHGVSKYGGGLGRAVPATTDMLGVQWLNSRHLTIEADEEESARDTSETTI